MGKRHGTPPVIAAALTALVILCLVSTPMAYITMARYTASATVTASGRVATWDVKFITDPVSGSTGYFGGTIVSANHPRTGIGYPTQTTTRTFRIRNDSEVAADVTIQLRYVTSDTSTASASSTLDVINQISTTAASGLASVSLTTTHSGTITGSWPTYRFSIGADGTFTITTKATNNAPRAPSTTNQSTYWQNSIRKYRVYFNAVQID